MNLHVRVQDGYGDGGSEHSFSGIMSTIQSVKVLDIIN